jgi:hypothetical protein
MTQPDCERVKELLPDLIRGDIGQGETEGIEEHLRTCQDCQKDLEIIEVLRGAAPLPPPELAARIQARVREDLGIDGAMEGKPVGQDSAKTLPFARRRRVPVWALSAAAVMILALGTSVLWNGSLSETDFDSVDVASLEAAPESWLWDDGMVAGAPVFDGLSDEDLEALLKELEG